MSCDLKFHFKQKYCGADLQHTTSFFPFLLIPGIAIANQTRLKQKIDSIYFLNKICFYLVYFWIRFFIKN